jgi:hypothetical protein
MMRSFDGELASTTNHQSLREQDKRNINFYLLHHLPLLLCSTECVASEEIGEGPSA